MISFTTSVGIHLCLRSVSRSVNLSYCKTQCVRMTSRLYAVEPLKADLRKLKRLEKRFERKLRSVYEQFAEVPDSTVGLHHVYTVEDHGVYRAACGEGDYKRYKFDPDQSSFTSLCVIGGKSQEIGYRRNIKVIRVGKLDEQHVVPVLSADWAGDVDGTVQRVRLSPSESMLAATLKSNHSEAAKCILVRLEPDAVPQEPMLILDNVFSFEWATDDVLYYTTQEGLQCRHVCRLHLTDTGACSMLVYEEKDPEFFVEVIRSRDQRLLTINCSSKSSSEVWMIDSRSPLSRPKLVQCRQPGLLYHVEHSNNQLYILANIGPGHEYELLRTPLSSPAMCYWEPVFSPGPGAVIKDMEMLPDHCVFTLRGPEGRFQLQTFPLKAPNDVSVHHLPSWGCAVETERSDTRERNVLHFLLSSPVHPPARYFLSPMDERPLSCEEVHQHTALSECHTTRLQAISQDGTAVPLTLFHTKSLADLSNVPLLLHVYGAYGLDLNMAFSPEKRLLLEDNWALAYCHVRGGGECGLAWHRAGGLQHKQNGVKDLTACIQTLFQSGVSQPALTALTARSAGAVLAGALCNQHPHLLRAVLLQAPFLDVLSTMQDSSLPLTVEERGEWGDPLTYTQDWDNIASYCPCYNITSQLYPSMLITAYSEDSRVPLAGVLKYVEKLKKAIQTHTTNLRVNGYVPAVILDLQPGGDHFGPEDYDKSVCEIARQLAFLYTTLGLSLNGSR